MRTFLNTRKPDPVSVSRNAVGQTAHALVQLLERGRERPARWSHGGFAAEVTRERRRLHDVVRTSELRVPDYLDGSFGQTAEWLARDPVLVATALRKIEIDRSSGLPDWEDIVRRGLPATPSLIETATWFG